MLLSSNALPRVLSLLVAVCLWASTVAMGHFVLAQDSPNEPNAATVNENAAVDESAVDTAKTEPAAATGLSSDDKMALFILAVGIVTVLGLIIVLKVNAFIALIAAAMVVSLMAAGPISIKIGRVASAFGSTAGSIGIVIALAAVIGKCMLDSGAADRIVRAFLNLLGEKRAPIALMGSGFVLAVPVFFDTVFYLLVPLARSLHRSTGKQYLKYILAIGAGAAITHTLVPPTPGPLLMASNLGVDIGMMIMVGAMVALPSAIVGLFYAGLVDRFMDVPMRQIGGEPDPEPLADSELPSLWISLLPVLLPVFLISTNTVMSTIADSGNSALLKLTAEDITDWPALRGELEQQLSEDGSTPASRMIELIGQSTSGADPVQFTALIESDQALSDDGKKLFTDTINAALLPQKGFYDEEAFLGIRSDATAKMLLGQNQLRMKKVNVERLNRSLLESTLNTPERNLITPHVWETGSRKAANITSLLGDANLALLLSTVIAMWVMVKQRGLSRTEMAHVVEVSLMSGGVIILITSGGGAFGAMLTEANVGDAIRNMFQISGGAGAGTLFLMLGFLIAAVLKVAQGSSTVAMITGSAMMVGAADPVLLGFHPVYLATAIGSGSLVGAWMNDSGFWIFSKMGGLTEVETLKAWSSLLLVLGVVGQAVTVALSKLLPLLS